MFSVFAAGPAPRLDGAVVDRCRATGATPTSHGQFGGWTVCSVVSEFSSRLQPLESAVHTGLARKTRWLNIEPNRTSARSTQLGQSPNRRFRQRGPTLGRGEHPCPPAWNTHWFGHWRRDCRIRRAQGAERPESRRIRRGFAAPRRTDRPGRVTRPARERRRRSRPRRASARRAKNEDAIRCRTPSSNGSRAPPQSRPASRASTRPRTSANATAAR